MNNEYFQFLDELRDQASINMMGAAIRLQNQFSLSKQEAKDILLEWMNQN